MEEWSRQDRNWFEQEIIYSVMQDKFYFWMSNTNTAPLHIALRIAARAFKFNNIHIMHHLFKYRWGITTEMKWMVCKRPENIRLVTISTRFPMKRLAQIILRGLANNTMNAKGFQKLNQKTNTNETSFSFQQICGMCSLLLLFQKLNSISLLIANILEMEKCEVYDGGFEALHQTWLLPNYDRQCISYPTPASFEVFLHDNVWLLLSDAIMKLYIQFVTFSLQDRPATEYILNKPTIGVSCRLLQADSPIHDYQILDAFTEPGDTSNLFCTLFLRCTS